MRATARIVECPACRILLSVQDAEGGTLAQGEKFGCNHCGAELELCDGEAYSERAAIAADLVSR